MKNLPQPRLATVETIAVDKPRVVDLMRVELEQLAPMVPGVSAIMTSKTTERKRRPVASRSDARGRLDLVGPGRSKRFIGGNSVSADRLSRNAAKLGETNP